MTGISSIKSKGELKESGAILLHRGSSALRSMAVVEFEACPDGLEERNTSHTGEGTTLS